MRRAFIGFSGPIGYAYREPAAKARNDRQSSPNPVLYGATAMLVLYDELWFACESLCPQALRNLPYVRFLDRHGAIDNVEEEGFTDAVRTAAAALQPSSSPGLSDLFDENYSDGMAKFLRKEPPAVDNHTHGLDFLGGTFSGNLSAECLAADLWLIHRHRDLRLIPVLNPVTARFIFPTGIHRASPEVLATTQRILRIDGWRDIVSPAGPYHQVLEELRGDPLIEAFRDWMDGNQNRLSNQSLAMIEADVNARVAAFTDQTLRARVEIKTTARLGVELLKELATDLTGLGMVKVAAEAISGNADAREHGWEAFIAMNRQRVAAIADRRDGY